MRLPEPAPVRTLTPPLKPLCSGQAVLTSGTSVLPADLLGASNFKARNQPANFPFPVYGKSLFRISKASRKPIPHASRASREQGSYGSGIRLTARLSKGEQDSDILFSKS